MIRFLALAMVAVIVACSPGADAAGLSDERFIAVVVELRRATEHTRSDSERFPMLRDSILDAAGVTEVQLRAYVDAHADDLRHMAEIWSTVNRRLAEPTEP